MHIASMISYFLLSLLAFYATAIMISKKCPYDEIYNSCSFLEEYTCWETEQKLTRVKAPAKRLPHCWSGCVCRKGTVRAYPNGPCVRAYTCRDRTLLYTMMKLPQDFES